MHKVGFVIFALFGVALGGNLHAAPAQAIVPAAPAAVVEQQVHSAPQRYQHEVPAAAIRNVETVDVTKTITPVITKTTTRKTHSEPALSVGHVQGYSQSAHGPAKVAPVQYNTQYTQYLNPTVGVNGPVTYAGPAVGQGIAVQEGVAVAPVPQPVAQPVPVQGVAVPVQPAAQPVAVADPQPVLYSQQAYAAPIAANFGPAAIAPAAYNAAPNAYNAAFAGRIVNPSPLFGFNNQQFLSANNLHQIPAGPENRAYATPPAAAFPAASHAAQAAVIGIQAFDTSALLTSAGYDSAHHNIHAAF